MSDSTILALHMEKDKMSIRIHLYTNHKLLIHAYNVVKVAVFDGWSLEEEVEGGFVSKSGQFLEALLLEHPSAPQPKQNIMHLCIVGKQDRPLLQLATEQYELENVYDI